MQGIIQMNHGAGTSRPSLCMVIFMLCLTGLSGCGGVETFKNTLRAASGTMVRITDLSLRFEGSLTGGHLEEVEDRVFYACQNLFDSADYRFRREAIPLGTQIGVVFTANECQTAVDQAQPELEDLQHRAPSSHN